MAEMRTLEDQELMARVATRDEQALTELYRRYGDAVYSLAMRMLNQSQWAEEVTQDTFLKAWHQADRWSAAQGELVAWLLTITRHTAIDLIRRERRRPERINTHIDDLAEVLGNPGLVDDPNWQDGRFMAHLMRELPKEQSMLIQMAFYQGYSHSDIAELLGLPLGTVKTRLRLGLQKLKSLWLIAKMKE
ncbi:MAG: sigma-70 family RNA polymerase sigma factor [Anaerolineae bacterium]